MRWEEWGSSFGELTCVTWKFIKQCICCTYMLKCQCLAQLSSGSDESSSTPVNQVKWFFMGLEDGMDMSVGLNMLKGLLMVLALQEKWPWWPRSVIYIASPFYLLQDDICISLCILLCICISLAMYFVFAGGLTMRSGQRPLGATEARNQFSSCCRSTVGNKYCKVEIMIQWEY